MAVPYTFGTATSSIPLSQLDSNFNTVITLGNTAIQLGNTVTTLNNMTLANVTISSGNVTITNVAITTANVTTANITTAVIGTATITTSTTTTANVTTANITTDNITNGTVITSLTLSYGTANGVAYLNGSKVLTTGSALTFDGTNFATTGTATAAKLIPTGSSATGNGLYLPAANSVGISTNGTNAVYIDSSQNVGIGTSSPASKLHINGTLTVSNSSTQRSRFFWDATNGLSIFNTDNTPLCLGTADTERMRIDSSGNVGIGTTSPLNKLQIKTQTNGNAGFANSTSVAGGVKISCYNDAGSSSSPFEIDGSTLQFNIASVEKARIDSSGNVGIGTSSPGFKLDVLGSTNTVAKVKTTASGVYGALQIFNSNTNGEASIGYRDDSDSDATSWVVGKSVGASDAFGWYYGSTRMVLDSSGNLLVGKTAVSDTTVGFQTTSGGRVACGMASGDGYVLYSTSASAYRFYVTNAGQINATSIVINAISDQRLKENVRDIDTGLNAIMALKPRRFDWKEGKGQDKKNVAGFIAQEFEDVFPECVGTTKAGGDGIEYKNINHETLIPTLVKAIQEQQALITSLTARITALELT
jgi:hypothetical protein